MNLLLTSSFPMAKNDTVADIIHRFTKNPKIVFIGYNSNAKKYIKKIESYSFSNVDFLNLEKGFRNHQFSDYNIIIMHGGNPSKIKELIVKVKFDYSIDNENALVVTTSGSSCVFSKSFALLNSLYPAWKNEDSKGLNYFPYEILPHFQRYKKNKKEIETYASYNKVYALTDGTAISYIRDKIELIGDVDIL